jgi:N-acetylmuramoyl-L-alanine amidase
VRRALGVLVVCLAAAGSLIQPAGSNQRTSPNLFDTVVIDAGHGGEDKGARSSSGLLEKDLVLDIANRVADRLQSSGFSVVMTRKDDRFIALEERTSIANDARGDLFVSIHANAAADPNIRGIETFFLALDASDDSASAVAKRENRALGQHSKRPSDDAFMAMIGDLIVTEHMEESNEFARLVQGELATGSAARGVKQAPFVVLEGVQMPSSLVEIGFLTNRQDEKMLTGSKGRDQIAAALVRATLEFARRYDARRGGGAR